MKQIAMRRGLSFLLAFALLVGGIGFTAPVTSHAASVTTTHYKFIIACVFTWGDTAKGTWDPAAPNGKVTKDTSTDVPNSATNVKVYQYNPNTLDLNKLDNVESWYTADDYRNKYRDAAVQTVSLSTTGKVINNTLNYTWSATLTPNVRAIDVKYALENGEEEQIKDLMGGYPDNMQGFLNSREGGKFGDTIEGWLYFVPYIIQYDLVEDVPINDLEVVLNLPSKAKVNENYVASDASLIPDGATVSDTILQKSTDDGKTWSTVSGWNGKSRTESSAVTGEILYRLTIILKDGRSGSDTKSILIYGEGEEEEEDDPDINAIANLHLPATTYEGHPVDADDDSIYFVNDQQYSATRMYAEGLASNRFSIVESGAGSISKVSGYNTKASAVFPTKGNYNVQLRISPKGAGALYDTKPIEVLKTPTIEHILLGVQKQNRKQTLSIQVATNPDNPLVELWVELENLDTDEVVRLVHKLDGSTNTLQNSENIKTRPIAGLESDAYWTKCELDFLTKEHVVTTYKYRIYAKDSRGLTDEVEVDFEVVPDEPPVAAIEMDNSFLRGASSNTAVLAAKDISTTDGDQLERTWHVALPDSNGEFEDVTYIAMTQIPGYMDNSFGTGQSVEWEKEGVGQTQVQLHVKDVWTEETLPEYITEEDYLTDTTTKITEVQNVAPIVSLEPIKARSANVVLLAGSLHEAQVLKESVNDMQTILLQYAVDAQVTVGTMAPAASDIDSSVDQGVDQLWSKSAPLGFNAYGTSFEEDNYILDDTAVYRIEATWKGYDSGYYPELPYYIRSYDGVTGNQNWSYAMNDATMYAYKDISLALDDSGKYLFYRISSRTMVLDRQTGALLTTLDLKVGDYSVTTEKSIYTFRSDGIYRISLSNGTATKIHSGTISGEARMIDGKSHFLAIDGLNLLRGVFDAKTEQVVFHRLQGNGSDPATMSYKSIGIDTAGTLIIHGIVKDSSAYVYYFGLDNTMKARISVQSSGAIEPVYNEAGISNYVAASTKGSSGSSSNNNKKYYTYVYLYGVDGTSNSTSYYDKNGYPSESSEIILARQFGNHVYVGNGAMWTWIYNDSYNTGSKHGYPQRTKVVEFNVSSKSAKESSIGSLSNTEEYGMASDTMLVTQVGANSQYGGTDTITAFAWEQNIATILLRYLNRYMGDDADLQVLGIYDSTNSVEGSNVSAIAAKLKNLGIDFYYTTDIDTGTYGSELADQVGGTVLPSSETFTKDIAESMIATEDTKGYILQLQTSKETDTLRRAFTLDPGVEYFYEYDLKTDQAMAADIVEITPDYIKTLSDSKLISGERYVVTSSILETFNSKDYNQYFTLNESKIKEGKYQATEVDVVSKYAYVETATESVKFTVPEGKQAIVSWDYTIKAASSPAWNGNYFQIDGTRWEEFVPKSQSGHYTHTQILGGGTHSIAIVARGYRNTTASTYMDNLQVDFVEKASDLDLGVLSTDASAVVSMSNGWSHITGSVTAPNRVQAYTRQAADYYSGSPDSIRYVDASVKRALTVSPPSGKVALHYNMSVSASGKAKMELGTYSWTKIADVENSSALNVTGFPTGYILTMKNWEGGKFTYEDSNSRSIYIRNIEMYLGVSNEMTENNLYFFDDNKLFVANDRYDGSVSLAFAPGTAGSYQIQNFRIYTIQNGAKVYLSDQPFRSDTLTNWKTSGTAKIAIIQDELGEEEQTSLIYKKGELVAYGISYYDYEADPSKRSYWRYTHMPFNDGEHPDAAVILDDLNNVVKITDTVLDTPIDRFYIDGKYIVEHWQEDDTSRGEVPGGNLDYDKASNVESITFYVQGSGEAPWITSIRTVPGTVKEGDSFKIQVGVDDKEKDELILTTEVYKEGKLIYTHRKEELNADETGTYPSTLTDTIPELAQTGHYEVVCTVRDWSGVGLDSYAFDVITEGGIEGMVQHTDQWNQNRKTYNVKQFGEEVNYEVVYSSYKGQSAPRKRGTNVFWSGETFVLEAGVKGSPTSVTCQIVGTSYSTVMKTTGAQNSQGETIYTGTIWNSDMINKWGRENPEQLTFLFVATYSGGSTKEDEAAVIVDTNDSYWNLHRYF